MDIKTITENYKEFSDALNLAVLLINKTVPTLNEKIRPESAAIKNYTNFMMSFNLLTSSALHVNYARKAILRELNQKKKLEYVQKKIQSVNDNYEIFTRELDAVIENLHNFNDGKSDTEKVTEIKNLADLRAVLKKLAENIQKKFYVKISNDNKIILENLRADNKTGGAEAIIINREIYRDVYNELLNENITGGNETTETYVGGNCYIGGNVVNNIKNRVIQLNLLKKDSKLNRDLFEEKYQQLIPDEYMQFIKHNRMYDYLLSYTYTNFVNQIKYMATNFILILQSYLTRRTGADTKAVNMITTDKNSFKIETHFELDDKKIALNKTYNLPAEIHVLYTDILNLIGEYLRMINVIDKHKLVTVAENMFHLINETDTPDELANTYQQNLLLLKDAEINARAMGKTEIFKLFHELLKIKNPVKKVKIAILKNLDKKEKDKKEKDKKENKIDKNKMHILNSVIATEKSVVPELQKQENIFNSLADKLNSFTLMIEDFLSPENNVTCIKKPAAYLENLIIYALSKKLGKKRWQKNITLPLADNIQKIKLYNAETGLNLSSVEKEIERICCPKL